MGPLSRRSHRQGGYLMFELAFVLAVACLAAVWGADAWRREADAAAGRAAGAWLLEIRGALARMLARHRDDLAQGVPPRDAQGGPAYADPHAPRLEELIRHGHLPSGFPTAAPGGMRVAMRILRDPACPAEGCRLDALAYSVAPAGALNDAAGAQGDPAIVAEILAAAGGYGGHVDARASDRLRGPNFHFANPLAPGMGRLAAGTVAVWAGLDLAGTWPYLRLGDRRNPDFQGDVGAAGAMHAAGRLSTDGHLLVGAVARMGASCAPDGLMARAQDGASLSCVDGRWSTPGGFGGAFSVDSRFGCRTAALASTANPRTGDCSCPAGHAAIQVSRESDGGDDGASTRGYVCVR
ncbi:hypothetical protein CAL29_19485 [Bordetella genomosp. 10]|uniref:Prepilin n=1 Tax=Bordetella genomosp. 10 TaxID=1416804 RepID=A0A261RZC8_9BORD|nr:hypothetical protein [Bordetella genomosp. 10]OZI30241.1 hypothetical protein CAL29_19485 [Bordetella genomosp. 10]